MDEKQKELKVIKQKELIRIFKDHEANESDTRFVFLLGAGTSIQSGIPLASSLAKKWAKEIKEDLDEIEYKQWLKQEKIDENNISASYTKIFKTRFANNPKNGYETLQKLMEKIEPSIGYTILSQILEHKKHNFVITTNFDSLIEDSLFLFTSKRPLVCGHESLASFIQMTSTRPTIIKVHRDILLDPYNTPDTTCNLEDSFNKALTPIIENSPIIVLGYGGHDDSIMKLLTNKKRQPIYWCLRNSKKTTKQIQDILTEDDRIVEIDGFDEFMVDLQSNVYNFETIKSLSLEDDNKSLIVQNALQKVKYYKKELLNKLGNEVKESHSKEFKENIKSILPNWWEYELKVQKASTNEQKENLYKEGIEAHPKSSELYGNYANFLCDIKKDFNKAEEYYLKALELEPNDASFNGNYANFLSDDKKDFNKAEEYYLKALKLEPNKASFKGNYANFLCNIKKDFNKAEEYYLKALELEPNNVNVNGNYASYLFTIKKKEQALFYIEKAFELNHEENDLTIEIWFYIMANCQDRFEEAENEINKLLEKGIQSIGWNFSNHIQIAIEENHPNIEVLKEYAYKISEINYSH